MSSEKIAISISTFEQGIKIIKFLKKKNIKPYFYIKNYLIKYMGIDWLFALINSFEKKFSKKSFAIYVDAGLDTGLTLLLIKKNIKYIKIKSNKTTLNKLKSIASKNSVLLNPSFNIIEFRNIKNAEKKLFNIYLKD